MVCTSSADWRWMEIIIIAASKCNLSSPTVTAECISQGFLLMICWDKWWRGEQSPSHSSKSIVHRNWRITANTDQSIFFCRVSWLVSESSKRCAFDLPLLFLLVNDNKILIKAAHMHKINICPSYVQMTRNSSSQCSTKCIKFDTKSKFLL